MKSLIFGFFGLAFLFTSSVEAADCSKEKATAQAEKAIELMYELQGIKSDPEEEKDEEYKPTAYFKNIGRSVLRGHRFNDYYFDVKTDHEKYKVAIGLENSRCEVRMIKLETQE